MRGAYRATPPGRARHRSSEKRLSVVKAPAGFGKTSLAAAWVERLLQSGNLVAWFSIDANDNQPTQFLFYVSHALKRARDGVGSPAIDLILETSLISPPAIVSTLINGLAEIDEEVYLFLEDYHCVSDPAIHDAVAFLLRHAPSNLHVVLATRTEPPLPLAALRAQNQLLEIDVAPCGSIWRKRGGFSSTRALGPWTRRSSGFCMRGLKGGPRCCGSSLPRPLNRNRISASMCDSCPPHCGQSVPTLPKWSTAFRAT